MTMGIQLTILSPLHLVQNWYYKYLHNILLYKQIIEREAYRNIMKYNRRQWHSIFWYNHLFFLLLIHHLCCYFGWYCWQENAQEQEQEHHDMVCWSISLFLLWLLLLMLLWCGYTGTKTAWYGTAWYGAGARGIRCCTDTCSTICFVDPSPCCCCSFGFDSTYSEINSSMAYNKNRNNMVHSLIVLLIHLTCCFDIVCWQEKEQHDGMHQGH